MRAPRKIKLADPETTFDKVVEEELSSFCISLSALLNGGLKFSDNFNMEITSVTTDAIAGTETIISHGLGRIPADFFVGAQDKAGTIYRGSTAWSESTISIKGSVASITANIYLF